MAYQNSGSCGRGKFQKNKTVVLEVPVSPSRQEQEEVRYRRQQRQQLRRDYGRTADAFDMDEEFVRDNFE